MAAGAQAQAQFEAGELGAARDTVNKAIQERDDIAALHLLRARIEMAAQAPANAFNAYTNVLTLDSGNMDALLGVAQLGLQLGHLKESEDAADRVLTLNPDEPNALVIKGLHNIIKRRYADTLANADAILKNAPADEGASVLKARALALLNRGDEALAVIENARKASGNTPGVAITLLELARQRGDGRTMIAQMEQLHKLNAADSRFDLDAADTYYKLGEPVRARAILSQYLLRKGISEKDAQGVTRLWAEYDPAPLDDRALATFGDKAEMTARKAVVRFYLDRSDLARAGAVLQRSPASDDVDALRARLAVAEGRTAEGLDRAKDVLARDKTHCDALTAEAQAELANRRVDAAIVAGQAAVSNCPQMIPAYVVLARAHEMKGSRAAIAITYRDAFDRNDQDSGLTRAYTSWLVQTGQGARALAIADRLTKNTPALISAWKLYGELCAKVPGAGCAADAAAGLATAGKRFGPDPRTGELPPTGLFGRLSK